MAYSDNALKKFRYHSKISRIGSQLSTAHLLTILVTPEHCKDFYIGDSFFKQPKWKECESNDEEEQPPLTVQQIIEANHSKTHLFKALNGAIVRRMTTVHHFVTQLQVELHYVNVQSIEWLASLLESWRHQLHSLHLVVSFRLRLPLRIMNRLYNAINSLTALESLNLQLHSFPLCDLPIIGQLQRLMFYSSSKQCVASFFGMLENYGHKSQTLQYIELGCRDITDLFILSDHLLRSVKRIQLYRSTFLGDGQVSVSPILIDLSNLTSLQLRLPLFTRTSLRRLFEHLSLLHQLTDLEIDCIDFETIEVTTSGNEKRNNSPLAQLTAVKYLKYRANITSHNNLSLLNLPQTVPNVQFIDLAVYGSCSQCEINFKSLFKFKNVERNSYRYVFEEPLEEGNAAAYQLAERCLYQLMSGLKSCPKRRMIWHNYEEIFGSFRQLLDDDDDDSGEVSCISLKQLNFCCVL